MELQSKNISPNNFEQCIKCTICTVYCPVLSVNPEYPGPKEAGPDGERYRLKDPKFYDRALKMCLNCKRCEVACPSGVNIGDIIQNARIKYSGQNRSLRDIMLASTDEMGSLATKMSSVTNFMLRRKPVKMLLDGVFAIDAHRQFPKYASTTFEKWMRKEAPDQSRFRHSVAYFHGCYVNYNNPQLGRDFVAVMNAIGYGVELLEKERCCGVAKIANGLIQQAKKDADTNMKSIRAAINSGNRAVIGTSSTCIFTLRDEYSHILGLENADMREWIFLATKFIHELVDAGKIKLVFRKDFHEKAAYHTPCHMQKMGWAIHTVELLKMIPGLDLRVLEQKCCGIAGTYGFKKENYPTSQAIGSELFGLIKESGAERVITDCETCKWQIEMSTGLPVDNPVTVLARALDLEATAKANGVK